MANQPMLPKATEELASRVAALPENLQLAALSYVLGLDTARKTPIAPPLPEAARPGA